MHLSNIINYISVIIVIILVVTIMCSSKSKQCGRRLYYEKFDATGTEFLPLGEQQYDLRGFPVYNRPLYDCWYDHYKNCYNSNF